MSFSVYSADVHTVKVLDSILPCVGTLAHDGLLNAFPVSSHPHTNKILRTNRTLCIKHPENCKAFFQHFEGSVIADDVILQIPKEEIEHALKKGLKDEQVTELYYKLDGSRGYRSVPEGHPSRFPGNQTKTLIDREKSFERLKELCRRNKGNKSLCRRITQKDFNRVMQEVDDEVFFSMIGRQRAGDEDAISNMYIASATDPQSGIYSVRQNKMPDPEPTDIDKYIKDKVGRRSDAIQESVDDLRQHRDEYFTEGDPQNTRDGKVPDMYTKQEGIKNGAVGTHAEVLASNGVLSFKDDVGRCLKDSSKCSSLPSCMSTRSCSLQDWETFGMENYEVKLPSNFESRCLRPKDLEKCFPPPPRGGHKPDSLFLDVRGGNEKTAAFTEPFTGGKSVIPGEDYYKQFNSQGKRKDYDWTARDRKLLSGNLNRDKRFKGMTDRDLQDQVLAQIKQKCQGQRRRSSCEVAYKRSVAYVCSQSPSNCSSSVPDLDEARRAVTARVTGQENVPGIQFGAGERCVHCWHILGRQNFTSTLNTGSPVHRPHRK